MLNISEWPNYAAVCSLSQILETGPIPQKYYLSGQAARGILRRAEKRGKSLPPLLQRALRAVADLGTDFDCDGGLFTARMVAFGEYDSDGTASTIKQRDWKDATDLVAHSLRGEGFDASEDGTGRGTPIVPVQEPIVTMDIAGALAAEPGMKQQTYVNDAWAVRRLTPVECARLQGFPDNYPRITYRGKIAADGPIYKALGNSWAVPCGAWILKRTANALASTTAPEAMERNG